MFDNSSFSFNLSKNSSLIAFTFAVILMSGFRGFSDNFSEVDIVASMFFDFMKDGSIVLGVILSVFGICIFLFEMLFGFLSVDVAIEGLALDSLDLDEDLDEVRLLGGRRGVTVILINLYFID